MKEILLIAFCAVAIAIIILVLLQNGKGAGMGSAFGAGASATLFGSSGSASFLARLTTILGILFFVICLALANLSSGSFGGKDTGKFSDLEMPTSNKPASNPTQPAMIDDVPVINSSENGVVSDIPQ